jgi:glutathione peroxidase
LFEWIKAEKPGLLGVKRVLWNFEKALINGKGEVVGRWRSITKPESLEGAILKEIDIASKNAKGAETAAAETKPAPTATESAAPAAPAEGEAKLA